MVGPCSGFADWTAMWMGGPERVSRELLNAYERGLGETLRRYTRTILTGSDYSRMNSPGVGSQFVLALS